MKMKKLLSFSLAIIMLFTGVLSQVVFVNAEGATVDYNDAPYAGVYAVTADKATTITTEIGSVTTLAAGETGYMYLVKGANNVDITNGAALTITDLDDNGLAYLDQVDIVNEPILDPSIDTHEPVDGAQYITIGAGESRTFTHTSYSGAGIYYPYIAGTAGATIKVIADTGFYADIYLMGGGSSGWSDANKADPELIYLRDGVQEITIINPNSYSIDLIATKFGTAGCLSQAAGWQEQMKVKELKVVPAADLVPEPTPEPTLEPTPEPTPEFEGIIFTGAYAGVYEVTADKDTTITTEIGSVTELSAGETGYMYLVKGANKVGVTNDATLTITDLDDNGLSYLDQVNIPNHPVIFGQEDPVISNLYRTMEPGESYTFTYTPSKGMNGIVYAYIYFSDEVENTWLVTTDGGFKTTVFKPAGHQSTLAWQDAARNVVSLLYVKGDSQEITITNIGQNTGVLTGINIHSAGEYSPSVTVDMLEVMTLEELKPAPTPEPTPEPTPVIYKGSFSYAAETAGIYEVTADADVTIENETGSKVDLVAGGIGYIYLVRGNNTIKTTKTSANVAFTALENNGLDYIAEITDTGAAVISGQEDTIVENLGYELAPGAKYTFAYTPSAGKAGLVYPYMSFAGEGATTVRVIADTGFYADVYRDAGSTNHMAWADAAQTDLEMLYVRKGPNIITMENIGEETVYITNIKLHSVGELKNNAVWGTTLKLANLKVYNGEYEVIDYGYFPEGWDGVVENHPDYNADAEVLYVDAYAPNMSSEEGMELLGTDWSFGDETGPVLNKGKAEGIYLPAGSFLYYTLDNIPYTGVYASLVRYGQASYDDAALQIITNVDGGEYYTQHNIKPVGTWGDKWSYNTYCDDFIYLQEGTNYITYYNAGPGGVVLYAFDLLPLENSDNYLQYLGTAENPDGTIPEGWNHSFVGFADWNAEINPWTYGVTSALNYDAVEYYLPYSDNGVTVFDDLWVNYTVYAPEAGMYLVEAETTGTIHLETAVGDYVEFSSANAPVQYIYLEEGENVLTLTGDAGSEFTFASFYQLNNSDDYLGQKHNVNDIPTEPEDISVRPFTDRTNPDEPQGSLAGTSTYCQYNSNDAVLQASGYAMTYDVNCFFPGIYRVQARVGGTVGGYNGEYYPVITIDTDSDEGYRAYLQTSYAPSPIWVSTDANGAYQYVYLKEGINKVSVAAGGSHHELWALEFVLLTEEEAATVTMDDCKLTPPAPITINPYTDTLTEGGMSHDFYFYGGATTPPIGEGHGTQLLAGEWQRFEVTAKMAGLYQIETLAYVTGDYGTVISVETIDSKGTATYDVGLADYKYATGSYVTLKEGVNSVWVRNDGPGWVFLKSVSLNYVEDTSEIAQGAFIQGFNYIGSSDTTKEIPEYTVRNYHMGIHVANPEDADANTLTYQYEVTIPADDYYGMVMTGTVPLTPYVVITMNNGVEDIVMLDGELPYFGNENEAASVTITPEKVFLPAGVYTMTFQLTENADAGSETMLMTHVHSFEFTTLTRQDMFLQAMQAVGSTEDVKAVLKEFEDVLTSDITVTPETDFIYPEYAYNALLGATMLENGWYETYEDIKTAYDFAKNMITVSDDGAGNLVYTVQVGDWNEIGTTVLVAVYETDENGNQKLYMMGEGYLDYSESVGSYVPVEAVLYDYIPADGDQIKVFIWDSLDGLKPVF